MSDFALRLGLSILVGSVITAGLMLAAREYFEGRLKGSPEIGRNVRLSMSALGPNALMYMILAPWWAFVYQQVSLGATHSLPVNALTVLAVFVACDFSYYVEHWCGHRVRIFWRLHHGTHHTSDIYNIPLAYRVNFVTQFFTPIFYLPWLLTGFHPLLVLGFQLFVFHYQAWIHTESVGRLGILDKLINTPAIHRMHHSNDPAHQAVNLGGVMMVWDHLFRTYCKPRENIDYGITGMPATSTYAGLYLDPWRKR